MNSKLYIPYIILYCNMVLTPLFSLVFVSSVWRAIMCLLLCGSSSVCSYDFALRCPLLLCGHECFYVATVDVLSSFFFFFFTLCWHSLPLSAFSYQIKRLVLCLHVLLLLLDLSYSPQMPSHCGVTQTGGAASKGPQPQLFFFFLNSAFKIQKPQDGNNLTPLHSFLFWMGCN